MAWRRRGRENAAQVSAAALLRLPLGAGHRLLHVLGRQRRAGRRRRRRQEEGESSARGRCARSLPRRRGVRTGLGQRCGALGVGAGAAAGGVSPPPLAFRQRGTAPGCSFPLPARPYPARFPEADGFFVDFRPISAPSRRSLCNCGHVPGRGKLVWGGPGLRSGAGGPRLAPLRSRRRASAPSCLPRRLRSPPGSCSHLENERGSELLVPFPSGCTALSFLLSAVPEGYRFLTGFAILQETAGFVMFCVCGVEGLSLPSANSSCYKCY